MRARRLIAEARRARRYPGRRGATNQCRQPSLSTSILKPLGIRGASPFSGQLHRPQGAPAAPHPQAFGIPWLQDMDFKPIRCHRSACTSCGLDQAQRQLTVVVAFVRLDKVLNAGRHVISLQVAPPAQLARDVFGNILRPFFGGVERHDANRVRIFAGQQVCNGDLKIRGPDVGLAIGPAVSTEVVNHDVNVMIQPELRITKLHATEPGLKCNQGNSFRGRVSNCDQCEPRSRSGHDGKSR